ncbi:hypothetical protein B0H15DRAFT_944725 [Mycena belliarum]|uniref:Uncharacterized protein n=1 Tax=Mycena belliarum TaxID=1033014 RepID=A0AAD6UHR1_9AGAR|nr:hypothetical protein B0H15DRAFT_944725 [Mycena belliae]
MSRSPSVNVGRNVWNPSPQHRRPSIPRPTLFLAAGPVDFETGASGIPGSGLALHAEDDDDEHHIPPITTSDSTPEEPQREDQEVRPMGTPGRLTRRGMWLSRLRPTLAHGWTRFDAGSFGQEWVSAFLVVFQFSDIVFSLYSIKALTLIQDPFQSRLESALSLVTTSHPNALSEDGKRLASHRTTKTSSASRPYLASSVITPHRPHGDKDALSAIISPIQRSGRPNPLHASVLLPSSMHAPLSQHLEEAHVNEGSLALHPSLEIGRPAPETEKNLRLNASKGPHHKTASKSPLNTVPRMHIRPISPPTLIALTEPCLMAWCWDIPMPQALPPTL